MHRKPDRYFAAHRADMLPWVPEGARLILEVGCGEGGFGRLLKRERGATVWGVEPDPRAAKKAARCLDRVWRGSFDDARRRLPAGRFEAVIFNDVLEHLPDPWGVLSDVRRLLAPGGVVTASVPNVLHLSVLKALIGDRDWRYSPHGVLDRTHLRFFTRKSLLRLFEESGYEVIRIRGVNVSRPWVSGLLAMATFGHLWDARYLQFAVQARPSERKGRE